MKIVIGEGSCGIAAGAAKVYDALQAQLTPADHTKLMVTGCNGMCFWSPLSMCTTARSWFSVW